MLPYLFALVPLVTAIFTLPANVARNDAGFGRESVTDRYGKRALGIAALISLIAVVGVSLDTCEPASLWLVCAVAVLTIARLYCHLRIALSFQKFHFPNMSTWSLTRSYLLGGLIVLGSSWLALVPWVSWMWLAQPAVWINSVAPDGALIAICQ